MYQRKLRHNLCSQCIFTSAVMQICVQNNQTFAAAAAASGVSECWRSREKSKIPLIMCDLQLPIVCQLSENSFKTVWDL